MQGPTSFKKKRKHLKLTVLPGCAGRRRPRCAPDRLRASRATGHPNGARVPGAPRGPRQRNGAHGSAEPGFHGPVGPRHAALRTAPAGPPRAGPLAPLWPSVRGTGLRPALLDTPGPEGRPATCRATCDTGPGTRLGGQDAASVTGSPSPDPASRTPHAGPGHAARVNDAAQA